MHIHKLLPLSESSLWSETTKGWTFNIEARPADWRVVGSRLSGLTTIRGTFEYDDELIQGLDICKSFDDGTNFHKDHMDFTGAEISRVGGALSMKRISDGAAANVGISHREMITEERFAGYNLYIIEFKDGRLDLGFTTMEICPGSYAIIKVDRGADCGKVKCGVPTNKCVNFIFSKNRTKCMVIPKEIVRLAGNDDIVVLEHKAKLEHEALKFCEAINYLDMKIVGCEYRWDMKKITFFFKSRSKVDFRGLVRELYKEYNIRIWMCSVERCRNRCLKDLVNE